MTSKQLAAEIRNRMDGVAEVTSPFPKQVVVTFRDGVPLMPETVSVLQRIAKQTRIDIEVRHE